LVWDEAVKISGADPDFHRRDLWEAIEAGAYPEWELGVQIFTEEQAEGFTFDVLDATKLVPEELVPITPVGRLVLNRNPDNFSPRPSTDRLATDGRVLEFIRDQYRHCKPMLVFGSGEQLMSTAPVTLPSGTPDAGIVVAAAGAGAADEFLRLLAAHRQFERETAPPLV
jgi:hypothetical protein